MNTSTLAALSLGPLLLTFLFSTFLPWLVALVTAQTAHPGLKAVLLLVLSSVTGVVTEWLGNPVFDWKIAITGAVVAFAIAVASHFGLWRPTGTTPGIQRAIPGGLGKPRG